MKLNFSPIIHDAKLPIIEIKIGDKILDLHNACEFKSFTFSLNNSTFLTEWSYYPNYQENEYLNFEILFENVANLEIESWDNAIPFTQNRILDELRFDENFPNKIYLEFNGGFKIIISSNNVLFKWKNEGSCSA